MVYEDKTKAARLRWSCRLFIIRGGLRLEIVGGDEVATYLSEFLIGREVVDSPGVDF